MVGFAMRRVLLALFLTVFAASVIGRSVERTRAWAAQNAHDFGRSTPDRSSARMGEARKHTLWQVHTKVLQDGPIAVSSVCSTLPRLPESSLHQVLAPLVCGPNDRAFSSRAPPQFA